ncbi:MAG TPA: DUF2807 domain-containing protein [Allosphingosinicella sp.]
MNKKLLAFALALPLAVIPAAAQTPVSVPRFDSVELRGGGDVIVRHGPQQRVTVLRDDARQAAFDVERGGKLVIRACRTSCRRQHLRVEIVTPDLDAVAITGGGSISAQGRFPAGREFAAAITGGGSIDARAFAASNVTAAIHGGGRIRTAPQRHLTAAIHGGGAITYTGDPRTTVAINGGGAVTRDR